MTRYSHPKVDVETVRTVVGNMGSANEITLPHGVVFKSLGRTKTSETWWNELPWNPPQGYESLGVDPKASDKPEWATVQERAILLLLAEQRRANESTMRGGYTERHRARFGDAPIMAGAASVHVGAGISHMAGLAHLASRAGLAGTHMPNVGLRDEGHDPITLWTQAELHDMLGALAERENAVQAAHNALAKQYHDLVAKRDDETLSAADRYAASNRVDEWIGEYRRHLEKAVAAVVLDALPGDLPTLRAVLTERLEAAATGQQKRIKGALSQQAIDNWAACVEVDQALREVALECAVGAQRIGNASDPAKAKAAFSAAVRAVEAVSPVNIPEVTHTIAGRRVTIRAVNPTADPAIRGPVTVLSTSVASTDGSTITGKVTASDGLPVKDSDPRLSHWDFADDYGGKVRIGIEVRNVCGPATHEVDLEVTANGGIRVA
ncbi:MAG: hypothetical protein F4X97_09920 [Boseongicola sp. SB0662_bin_57]|nr:hypothetical protein [Boseongicola sp. SB0662_bin_57]